MNIDKPLVTLTFQGSRFDDHGLELDVLSELITYQKIIAETARELWRLKLPNRQRMPKNFDVETELKIFRLEPGSVAVPLETKPHGRLFRIPNELNEAIELVTAAVSNVEAGNAVPDALPKNVLPLLAVWGKTLKDDEVIKQTSAKGNVAIFGKRVREHFEMLVSGDYSGEFDIVGTLVQARVDKPRLTLVEDARNEIEAPFELEDKQTILKALLDDHMNLRVRLTGVGVFSGSGILRKVDRIDTLEILGEKSTDEPELCNVVPIWEQLMRSADELPNEMKQLLPADAAQNLDQYLYRKKRK